MQASSIYYLMLPYVGVHRLATENRKWIPVVVACLKLARRTGASGFAGRWVLDELKSSGWQGMTFGDTKKQWFPGLRILERYGILKREDTARGGRQAYYTMLDPEGVQKALQAIGAT